MPDFLFLDLRTGVTPRVIQQSGASGGVQLGNSFGTALAPSAPTRINQKNLVISIAGGRYAVLWDGVYKFDGTDWLKTTPGGGLTFAVTSADVEQRICHTGLFPVLIGGVPYIAGFRKSSASDFIGFKMNLLTGTWSEGAAQSTAKSGQVAGNSNEGGITSTILYRNLIFGIGTNDSGGFSYDPASDSFADVNFVGSPMNGGYRASATCVFNDVLYLAGNLNATGGMNLWQYSSGSWVSLAGVTGALQQTQSNTSGRGELFEDGTYLYLINLNISNSWVAYRWSTVIGVPTDVSTTILPTAMRSGGLNGATRMHAQIYIDHTDPTSKVIRLFVSPDATAGSTWSMYNYNGPTSFIGNDPANATSTANDTGGNVAHAYVSDCRQGNERSWTSGQLDALITGVSPILGGEQVTAKVWGGGSGRTLKMYYSTESEQNLAEATLAGPVTGGTATIDLGGNLVDNVDADGSTSYTFVWNLAADSIVSGITRCQRYPVASV